MLKEKIDQIKNMMIKKDENSKKKIENLIVLIVILIITIIVIKKIWSNDTTNNKNTLDGATLAQLNDENNVTNSITLSGKNELEEKLENILNKIDGVGNVRVMITYSETSKTIAMYNEDNIQSDTQENDTRWRN